MTKTGIQIQKDVYQFLLGSELNKVTSGNVYHNGLRPRDSLLEDIIVIFTTGTTSDIQAGIITIHIFVPDISPYSNGTSTPNLARIQEIEIAAMQWVNSLTTDKSSYLFRLQQTICAEYEENINQHFVVVKLHYKYID